jgi:DNA-binding NarL/FixJ family response regulator
MSATARISHPRRTVAIGRFNRIVGRGIEAELAEDARLEVVAGHLSVDELEAALRGGAAEVAIISRTVEQRAWEHLRHACPNAGIIVIGPVPVLAYGMALYAAQVTCVAWRLDELATGELGSLVWRTAEGETLLVSSDGKVLAQRRRSEPPLLTPREIEVLMNLGEERKYAEIALRLGIAHATVSQHVKKSAVKLNIANPRELRSPTALARAAPSGRADR